MIQSEMQIIHYIFSNYVILLALC